MHLTGCYGISISGNCIYSCSNRNLLIEDSRQINVGNNTFRRHTPAMGTGVRIVGSSDITLNGCSILDEHPEGQPSGASLLELVNCNRINISGSQLIDGVPCGLDAVDCSNVNVNGCSIHETRTARKSKHAVRFSGKGQGNLLAMNSISPTAQESLSIAESTGVRVEGNAMEESTE